MQGLDEAGLQTYVARLQEAFVRPTGDHAASAGKDVNMQGSELREEEAEDSDEEEEKAAAEEEEEDEAHEEAGRRYLSMVVI